MKRLSFSAAAPLVLALAGASFAAEHEVKMLSKGEAGMMVFEPAYIRADPGDVVRFVPTDKGHNVESINEILPVGVEPFKSQADQEFSLTVMEPGFYGVKCTTHYAMGMIGLIQVGDEPTNLDAARNAMMSEKARERMDAEISQIE